MHIGNLSAFLFLSLPFLGGAFAGHAGDRHDATRHHDLAARQNGQRFSAKCTYYHGTWQTGNPGACGRAVVDTEFTVAMNTHQFKQSDCFKTISITRNGVTRQAQIVDRCPGCPWGGLDLTPSLFQQFRPLTAGEMYDVSWWYGGAEPPKPPPPEPTTTWTPPPKPTTTWKPPPSSSARPSSSVRSSSRFSSSFVPSSSAAPSSSAPPAQATSGTNNLDSLNQVVLRFADVAVQGAAPQ